MTVGVRYTYDHPQGLGLGEHHDDPGAHPRGFAIGQRGGAELRPAADFRSALAIAGPTDEQVERLEDYLGRTMADLDMKPGTVVTHVDTDEDTGLHVVEWADQHGDPRRTSVTDDQLAGFFTGRDGTAEPETPTGPAGTVG